MKDKTILIISICLTITMAVILFGYLNRFMITLERIQIETSENMIKEINLSIEENMKSAIQEYFSEEYDEYEIINN